MKQVIRSGMAAFALLLVASAASAQAAPRFVFINSQRVMEEAPGLQAARNVMQTEMQRLEQQIVPLRDQYQTMVQEFQNLPTMTTQERRRDLQQAIGAKQQEIQQRAQQLDQQAQQKQQELLAPELERINNVIEQLRAERGYSFIFDVSTGSVVAADPSLEITDEVLQRLRSLAAQGS